MKFLFDTPVIVAAALFPCSASARAFDLAASTGDIVLSTHGADELPGVFQAACPGGEAALRAFLQVMTPVIVTPDPVPVDPDDGRTWPIVRAALTAGADVLVSTYAPLLDAASRYVKALTPAQLLQELAPGHG